MPVLSQSTAVSSTGNLHPLVLPALGHNPLVSILVGNFNYAHYIAQAIESVQSQTYSHWELIICDDGSTDDSVAVIESYSKRDSRIRLVRQSNAGHGAALNTAYSLSRGEIVCLLDSDDLYLPEKVERVVAAFAAFPERGVVVHRVFRTDRNRRRQGVWPLSDSLPEGWLAPALVSNGGIVPYMPPTSGLSLRSEVARVLFPVATTPPLQTSPDQVLMRLAPLVTSIAKLSTPLAEYRLHGGNTYTASRITAASLTREIEFSHTVWIEQARFLKLLNPGAAAEHARSENSSLLSMMQYVRAKISNDLETRARHREFLALSASDESRARRLFWSASFYLPRPLFETAINLFLGQNWLKHILARLKGMA